MRFVVLHAHPLEDCLNVVLRDRVVGALAGECNQVEVVRLTQGEWIDGLSLAGADGLVFVYPTWWGGLPAPMLKWVQAELGAWIDGRAEPMTSPLRTVKRLGAVTTHGSPRRVNWLQGEPGRHLLKRSVTGLCAPGTKLHWIARYGIDQSEDAQIAEFLDHASARASALAA